MTRVPFEKSLKDTLEGPCPCCYCRRPRGISDAKLWFCVIVALVLLGASWWVTALVVLGLMMVEAREVVQAGKGERPVTHEFVVKALRDEIRGAIDDVFGGAIRRRHGADEFKN